MKNQKALIISITFFLALLCIGSVSADVQVSRRPFGWESKGRIRELQRMIEDNTARIKAIHRELVQERTYPLTKEDRKYLLEERNLLVEQNFKYKREIQRLRSQRS